jgi:hypothetical protein
MTSVQDRNKKPPRVTIQPAMAPDMSVPLPFHIEPHGSVADQDFWKGDPAALVGFQQERDVKKVDLLCDAFLADPQRAVGMFPVFVPDDSHVYVLKLSVESVEDQRTPRADKGSPTSTTERPRSTEGDPR